MEDAVAAVAPQSSQTKSPSAAMKGGADVGVAISAAELSGKNAAITRALTGVLRDPCTNNG